MVEKFIALMQKYKPAYEYNEELDIMKEQEGYFVVGCVQVI